MDNEKMAIPSIKQRLQHELDVTNFNIYLRLLQEWFAQRVSRDLLEFEICTLFGEKCLTLHNQLLESILKTSCSGVVCGPATCTPSQSSQKSVTTGSVPPPVGITAPGEEQAIGTPTSSQDQNSNIYIIPTKPGEEPFIYPPHAKDYPIPPTVVNEIDMMEQDPLPDCDWLQEAEVTFPANENNAPKPIYKNRFPTWFAHDFQPVHQKSYALQINIVQNVTHFMFMIKDMLERRPQLKANFVIPGDQNAPYLSTGCSLYGRLLVKAWDLNIQNVNPNVTEHAVNAVLDHIKNIIVGILKQRRSFRMRDKRIIHSVGVPYPNPYLRQGVHLYDEAYSSDTTKMADVVMQVPTPFPTIEEKERLAALQVASSYPSNESQFVSCKGTMMDVLLAIKNNPSMIPNQRTRLKLMETVLMKTKGFAGSSNIQYPDLEEEDESMRSSPLLPLASY